MGPKGAKTRPARRRAQLPGIKTWPTGYPTTDAVHYVACPHCGAPPGALCVRPSGRATPTHLMRLRTYAWKRADAPDIEQSVGQADLSDVLFTLLLDAWAKPRP